MNMKVYYPVVLDNNFVFEPKNFDDYFALSDGQYDKIKENSKANFYRCVNPGDFFGDFTWCDNATVLIMKSSITQNATFLGCNFHPIQNELEYQVICPPILDCLDFKKSKITYLPKTDTILSINKYVFKKNSIPKDLLFFKIKGLKASPVFCTETFRVIYENNKLSGLQLEEI